MLIYLISFHSFSIPLGTVGSFTAAASEKLGGRVAVRMALRYVGVVVASGIIW